jgi:5-methylcytosine-specific restriction endonuclease McrA
MNTYGDTQGNRLTTAQIERNISKHAKIYIEMQFIEHGYNFCETCGRSSGTYLDVSHTISRKKAKEDGIVEVLWDYDNLEILCRKCHQIKDKLI